MLTDEQLRQATSQLEVVKAIRDEAGQRLAYSKSAQFQVEKTVEQRLAYVLITKAATQEIDRQLGILNTIMDRDPDAAEDSDTTLAVVIDLIDGNRRTVR